MSWGCCGRDKYGRPIGYRFRSLCDDARCVQEIDRGLYYVCGGEHGGGEHGCGRYFCAIHLYVSPYEGVHQLCQECMDDLNEDGLEQRELLREFAGVEA